MNLGSSSFTENPAAKGTWGNKHRLCLLSVTLILLFSRIVCAQESHRRHEEKEPAMGYRVYGIHLTGTTRVAGYTGVFLNGQHIEGYFGDWKHDDFVTGTLCTLELGLGGASISIGRGGHFMSDTAIGAARIQMSLLRTWWKSRRASPSQWFLGPELQLVFIGLGTRLGYFWRIGGERKVERSFFSLGWVLGL